jgi:hypothetical protein
MKPHHKPFYEYRMRVKDVKEGHPETGFEGGHFKLKDKLVGCVERFQFRLPLSACVCVARRTCDDFGRARSFSHEQAAES